MRETMKKPVRWLSASLRQQGKTFLAVMGAILLAIFFWKIPDWQLDYVGYLPMPKDRLSEANEIRKTWAQIIGGAAVLITLYVGLRRVRATERTVEVAQEGQITERFTKAIDQLGNDKLAIRLGGIYALERIARDSRKDHWTIMEVLIAFVRERVPLEAERKQAEEVSSQKKPEASLLPTDIQAALTVIGRRKVEHEEVGMGVIDLSNTDLGAANLRGANLRGARLWRANLWRANLYEADLRKAMLEEANLMGADLLGADLLGAFLIRANLGGANLGGANLMGAELMGADLGAAYLWRANLGGANLWRANLGGAYLWEVNLEEANLEEANLRETKGLTQEQMESAKTNEDTILPDYLAKSEQNKDEGEGQD